MVSSDRHLVFKETEAAPAADRAGLRHPEDDLGRESYGLFGIPLDATDRIGTLNRIKAAANSGKPFLLSTPNVNFLVESQRDPKFRETLLQSDHCCPDGIPVVWLCRLLGIPIRERVSGSDLFEALRAEAPNSEALKVFLFGGGEGTAELVCKLLNKRPCGIRCVGHLNPGFGTVEDMSSPFILDQINRSGADFVSVFLSAKKAQLWLHQNRSRLQIPIRGQFGATINYQAGIVRRAPGMVQRLGFEWLWRIKEEPYLWRRYWSDGKVLAWLVLSRAIPMMVERLWNHWFTPHGDELSFTRHDERQSIGIGLVGSATTVHVKNSITLFRSLLDERGDITLDVSRVLQIDARFFGLLLMLRKELHCGGRRLVFTGLSSRTKRIFGLNGFEYLLDSGPKCTGGSDADSYPAAVIRGGGSSE